MSVQDPVANDRGVPPSQEAARPGAAREPFLACYLDRTTLLERVVDFLDRYNRRPCAH